MTLFGDWLEETARIQGPEGYGRLPFTDAAERARYFIDMGFSLIVELGEASNEIGWKPWGTDRSVNRQKFVGEVVDILHFAANLLVMVGCTDEELNEAYATKLQINWDRIHSGTYNGRTEGKCPRCHRALDDSAVDCFQWGNRVYCSRDAVWVDAG